MKKYYILTIIVICCFSLFISEYCLLAQHNSTAGIPFWAKNAGTLSQRFELAKQSTPELIAFIRRMPKGADLHNHVSGATYSNFILSRAEKEKLNYNLTINNFTHDVVNNKDVIDIEVLKNTPVFLAQFLNVASMRGWYLNTTNGHDHFFSTFGMFRGSPEEIISEIMIRNRYENLQYLELMVQCAPDDVLNTFGNALENFEPDNLEDMFTQMQSLMNDQKLKNSVHRYLDERETAIRKTPGLDYSITGNDADLVIRYITQVKRNVCLKDFFTSAVLACWVTNIDNRIIGFNVVSSEDHPNSLENFDVQMKIVDFLWKKMSNPKCSIHAGELVLRESPVEPMRNRIRDSIEKGHALRIGHGVSIAWEINVVGLLKKMKNEGILDEICLSSNEAILDVKDKNHPFLLYRRAGVPVNINTDDEGVNRSNLTMEFVKAIQRYDLKYEDVKELIRNSLEYSFLPGESLFIRRDYKQIIPGFKKVRSQSWKPTPNAEAKMEANPKLKRQVILERAFVEFEKSLLNGFEEH